MKTLNDLFEDMLQDVYFAEKTLTKALPKMAKKATSENFKTAITEHLAQTEEHVIRLESVFEMIGMKPKAKECPAILGLVKEAEDIMAEAEDDAVRDAGMVACAQAVEHYEIARYSSLSAWAEQLGMDDAAELLSTTLDEEIAADSGLTELALNEINDATPVDSEDNDEDENEDEDEVSSADEDSKMSDSESSTEQAGEKTKRKSKTRA